jgi:UDP-N-acetylmuramate--alanine ligase
MQSFQVVHTKDGKDEPLGDFTMSLPGRFNVMNALAAATAALELGVSADDIAATLREFAGIWRRFERVGEFRGATIISDYGHHPTAVRGTLEAARSFYPGRRIVLAFQPHHHNRTRKLFDEFVAAFDGADLLLLAEVYDVAGREADDRVSSRDLVEAVRARDEERGAEREVLFGGTAAETQLRLENLIRPGDVVLVMGAGDIYTVARKLVS